MEPIAFPGAPIKGLFYQIKTLQISKKFSKFPGRAGKLGKIYGILSRFMSHNALPYFELFQSLQKIYGDKLYPFWTGFLPHLRELSEGDERVLDLHIEKMWGKHFRELDEAITWANGLAQFSKDNPTGDEIEEVAILSTILWAIYISQNEDSLFEEVFECFENAEKSFRHTIHNYDQMLDSKV